MTKLQFMLQRQNPINELGVGSNNAEPELMRGYDVWLLKPDTGFLEAAIQHKKAMWSRELLISKHNGRPTKIKRLYDLSPKKSQRYEHYPVFVNRTQQGLARRQRFEEVPPDLGNLAKVAWEAHVLGWFWTLHTANGNSWLTRAMEISEPTSALKKSLLAVSLTRYGRLGRNEDAVQQGYQVYGEALKLLQTALYDEKLMWHDETLVSVRAMVLYELFESTSDSPMAWMNHLDGMTRLMEARGPPESTMAMAVVEDVRYALMLKALMLRKRSRVGEWNVGNGVEQELYSRGFELAALLERQEYDVSECQKLYGRLGVLKLLDNGLRLNRLACQLLLGFVMAEIGGDVDCDALGKKILELLPAVKDPRRTIFPLTCILWQFRNDEQKLGRARGMMRGVGKEKKVGFAAAEGFKVEPLVPEIARRKKSRPSGAAMRRWMVRVD